MANAPFVNFAGGELGKEAMARVSLEGYSATAEIMENALPDTAGTMMLRPGFEFLVRPNLADDRTTLIPFFYSTTVKYLLLLSDLELRIFDDDGVVVREAVTSSITDGTFPHLAFWTDISSGGTATSAAPGLVLSSNGTSVAGVRQAVTTANVGTVHGLNVEVARGPVKVRIGSTAGAEDILIEQTLRTGSHSLAFTPTAATYHLDITSTDYATRHVTSVSIAAAGDLVLITPWTEAVIPTLEREQSIDVMFISSGGGAKKRIERRGPASWSIVSTDEINGPFLAPNTDESITVTPSVIQGNGTLTANKSMFKAGHVGALFEITHNGQLVTRSSSGVSQWSEPIKVQGAGTTARTVAYTITGTWSATVVIQRSIGNTSGWADYLSLTANANTSFSDGLDNQTVYYRIGIGSTYTSGTAVVTLTYQGGSSTGVVRVTEFTSATVVGVEVVDTLAGTTATSEWSEGAWSEVQGWPKGTGLYDGRLYEGYGDRFAGSKSDAYESFGLGEDTDDAVLRTVATGRVEPIVAIVPLSRLVALTSGSEVELRSSSFDEPITPTNLTVRNVSTYGAAPVHPIVVDSRAAFVARSGTRAMQLVYDVEGQGYRARSLHRMHKKIGRPGLTQIAVSRHPDTRYWFVRSDGQLLVLLQEPDENVSAWSRIVTDGEIESVAVLPAADEDEVYVMVKRTINSLTRRYLERMGSLYLDDAQDARQLDSNVMYEGPATATITGAEHLAGKTVRIWADGARHPDRVVASDGTFELASAKTPVCYGLYYRGRYKSSKLAYGAQGGTALTMRGRPTRVSFMLYESMPVLRYGQSFTAMDELKERSLESQYDSGPGLTTATTDDLPIPEGLSKDPRICLEMESPYWVQLHGFVLSEFKNER